MSNRKQMQLSDFLIADVTNGTCKKILRHLLNIMIVIIAIGLFSIYPFLFHGYP